MVVLGTSLPVFGSTLSVSDEKRTFGCRGIPKRSKKALAPL